jgi:hypothetical protein
MKGDHSMQRRWYTQLSGMTLVGILMLVVAQGLVFSPEVRAEGGRGLEGTWLNEVKFGPCPLPSDPVTISSMTTYMRGGILIEGGLPRSAGHGIWERTGPDTFRLFFRAHSFDDLGRLVRITEVESHPELIKGDNPETPELEPYYLRGPGTNRFLNPDGTVISEGCNEATSRPILFEE